MNKVKEEKFYIVKYDKGSYDTYSTYEHFITSNRSLGQKWCTRANLLKDKWFKYYDELSKQEDVDRINSYNRAYQLFDYGTAWIEKIERR